MNVYIKDFGALPDGKTINTEAIQAAIDKCTESGGGKVIVSGGVYMTGTIILKSNVDLHLEADGTILGSPNCGSYENPEVKNDLIGQPAECGDYPEFDKKHVNRHLVPRHRSAALIYAEEAENIAITGSGTIDANGSVFIEEWKNDGDTVVRYRRKNIPTPPRVVFFAGCRNVLVKDVTMTNQPAGWSYWINDCDYVSFDRVKILAELKYPNNDGIHINSSRYVTVSNSTIHCGDDCIIVRANNISLKENKVCEKITVTNCNLTTPCAGIRIGWCNDGTIRNCSFSNLVMTNTMEGISLIVPDKKRILSDYGREKTLVENLTFSNIIMDKNGAYPVRISLEDSPETTIEAIRNLYFSNIHSRGHRFPHLHGRKGNPLQNIRFSDCTFEVVPTVLEDNGEYRGSCWQDMPESPVLELKYADEIMLNNTKLIVR